MMLSKSRAFVLHHTKYGDNSIVLKVYCETEGKLSLITSKARGKKGVMPPSLLNPLSLIEIIYYENNKGSLKRLKEVRPLYAYQSLNYDPVKSCITLFLAEVLHHVIHEEESNKALFNYCFNSFTNFDTQTSGWANFHILFLFGLSKFLGFYPEKQSSLKEYFDLLNGVYSQTAPPHPHFLEGKSLALWYQLYESERLSETSAFSRNERQILLKSLLEYYRLHIRDFGELKSLDILGQVLD